MDGSGLFHVHDSQFGGDVVSGAEAEGEGLGEAALGNLRKCKKNTHCKRTFSLALRHWSSRLFPELVAELVDGELLSDGHGPGEGPLDVVVAMRDGNVFEDVTRVKDIVASRRNGDLNSLS